MVGTVVCNRYGNRQQSGALAPAAYAAYSAYLPWPYPHVLSKQASPY